jgi:hypothetical protein
MKKMLILILVFVVHLKCFGSTESDHSNPNLRPQKNLMELPLTNEWVKDSFLYSCSYVKKNLYDTDVLAYIKNSALFATHLTRQELFFYGHINGSAVGTHDYALGLENLSKFFSAIIQHYPIRFSEDLSNMIYGGTHDPFRKGIFSGTCHSIDGRVGSWHFKCQEGDRSLKMILVISFERDSYDLLLDVIPMLD